MNREYEEYLNHKSVLDCETQRDLDRHQDDCSKILNTINEKAPYGAILRVQYIDPYWSEEEADKFIYSNAEEYLNILSFLDAKNGYDFVMNDNELCVAVYGSNYTIPGEKTYMQEVLVTYHFFNEEQGTRLYGFLEHISQHTVTKDDNEVLGSIFKQKDFFMDNTDLLRSLRFFKNKDSLFHENIIEIAMIAGDYMRQGVFDHIDSRDVNHKILELAAEFEDKYAELDWDAAESDYLSTITEFAEERLISDFDIEIDIPDKKLSIADRIKFAEAERKEYVPQKNNPELTK